MNVATRRQISARSAASEQSDPFISPVPSTGPASRCRVERHHAGAPDVGGYRDWDFLVAGVEPHHRLLARRELLCLSGHGAPVDGDTIQALQPAVKAGCGRVVEVGADRDRVGGFGWLADVGERALADEVDEGFDPRATGLAGERAWSRRDTARDGRECATRNRVTRVRRAGVVVVTHDRRAAADLVCAHVVWRARAAVVTCHGIRGVHAGARCRVAGIWSADDVVIAALRRIDARPGSGARVGGTGVVVVAGGARIDAVAGDRIARVRRAGVAVIAVFRLIRAGTRAREARVDGTRVTVGAVLHRIDAAASCSVAGVHRAGVGVVAGFEGVRAAVAVAQTGVYGAGIVVRAVDVRIVFARGAFAAHTVVSVRAPDAVVAENPVLRRNVLAGLGSGIEAVDRARVSILAFDVLVLETHVVGVVAPVHAVGRLGPDAIAVAVGHTALRPRALGWLHAFGLHLLHTVGVLAAGSAVPAFVAVAGSIPAAVVDGAAVTIFTLGVRDAGRIDEGARLVDGVEVVVGVRVLVVAHVLLELADLHGATSLVQHARGRLVLVGLAHADKAVGVRAAAEDGLFDLHLRVAQGELGHRVRRREHGQNRERRNEELEHEKILPSLRRGILRVIVVVFPRG